MSFASQHPNRSRCDLVFCVCNNFDACTAFWINAKERARVRKQKSQNFAINSRHRKWFTAHNSHSMLESRHSHVVVCLSDHKI